MYRKVLVPIDDSEFSNCVLPHVQAVVERGGVEEVIFFYAVEPLFEGSKGYFINGEEEKALLNRREKQARAYLNEFISKLHYNSGATLTAKVVVGSAAESIVGFSTHQEVDLMIMATHGRSGITRWLMGSVAERTLHWSCIPVLIVRPPECVPKL